MAKNKLPFLQIQILLTCLFAVTIAHFTRSPAYSNQSNSNQLNSNQSNSNQSNTSTIRFIEPILKNKPTNRGAPKDRKGAGTRPGLDCPVVNKPDPIALVPLMHINRKQENKKPSLQKPTSQQTTDSSSGSSSGSSSDSSSPLVLGLTTLEYPTFWFYVPYPSTKLNSLKFVLLDENNNYVTKEPISVNIPQTPGAISVSLSKADKPLEIDKYYHWYFLVDCNPQSTSEDVAIEGLVQRISPTPDLQRQLKAKTPRERARIYAREGIWQDAITILGKLRREKPQDTSLLADWKDLLQSVDLETVANEPIKDCCNKTKEISHNKF